MSKLKIAITQGDSNGVGYEVILKTFAEPHLMEVCTPVVYGSHKLALAHKQTLDDLQVNLNPIANVSAAHERKLNILTCVDENTPVEWGKATRASGEAAFRSLERACKDLRDGRVDALVTAPINKDAIQSDQFRFCGHTEYLASQFGHEGDMSLMLLMNPVMRVAVATNHLPIGEVAGHLSQELIVGKLKVLNACLKRDFGIARPRIAVLALNPHAGDNGLLGKEEQDIIVPAIEAAEQEGVFAIGPYAADGFFGAGTYSRFDAVLAMYHDQGLIPLKAFGMDTGVNYTAGLPIVRTSPDHGTGYDIAGSNRADETSFREAVYAAADIWKRRRIYDEAVADPLVIRQKQTNNKE